MRFPKVVRFRRAEATIYGKKPNNPFYRPAYSVAGKRLVRSFKSYTAAKTTAEQMVRMWPAVRQLPRLTGEQSRDALAALQPLETHRPATGRRFSVLAAVSKLVAADLKLGGRNLDDAIEGFPPFLSS